MSKHENQRIEWKASWRDDYLRWLCGFANAQGGSLILGKNDQGQAVGLPQQQQLLEELPNKIRDLLGLVAEVNSLRKDGHDLIGIRVYADKLKIWNAAELPENWTVQKLLGEHPSRPFNPAIANVFFRAGEIETWGRGISRIFEACQEAGYPEPLLRYEPNDLWLEFPFAKTYLAQIGESTPVKTPELILQILAQNPELSLAEVARQIGKSLSAVERASAKLVKNGHLKYIGPQRGGHWKVTTEEQKK